jgi:hypothetical protein
MLPAASENSWRLNQKVGHLLDAVVPDASFELGILLCLVLSLAFLLLIAATGAELLLFFKMLFDLTKVEIGKAAGAQFGWK